MDFAMVPPEINSGRIYAGPGSGPMLAAATAWDGLADELYATAASYQSVVSELVSGAWSGASSASMTAAAATYVSWLSATAAQAAQTAAQAKAAAAAYESAFLATVPPPVIAANRSLLMTLVATNFFGQNTPAIAATEADYAEMWAQDAAAMFGYAGSSAAASALTPFTAPPRDTDPSGVAGQAAAVNQAASSTPGTAQSIMSLAAVPDALQSLASAVPAAGPTTPLDIVADLINIFISTPTQLSLFGVVIPLSVLGGPVDIPFSIFANQVSFHEDDIVSGWNGEEIWPGTGPAPVTEFPAIVTNSGASAVSAVSAGVGEANTVGALSVPSGWTVTAPQVRPVALTLPAGGAGAAAAGAALEPGAGTTFNQMGLAGMLGPGMANTQDTRGGEVEDKAPNKRVAARGAGSTANDGKDAPAHDNPRIVVTGVAARIRQLARLHAAGRLTEEEFTEEKNRLLGR